MKKLFLLHPNKRDRLSSILLLEKSTFVLISQGFSQISIVGLITKLVKYKKLATESGIELSENEVEMLKLAFGPKRNQEKLVIEKPIFDVEGASPFVIDDISEKISQEDWASRDVSGKCNEGDKVPLDKVSLKSIRKLIKIMDRLIWQIKRNNDKIRKEIHKLEFKAGETHAIKLENFDTLELKFDRNEKADYRKLKPSARYENRVLGTPVKYLPNCGLFRVKAGEYSLLAARHKILLKDKGATIAQAYSRDSKDGRSLHNVILEKKVKRLKALSIRPEHSKVFWNVAWHEFMESRVYLVSCLNHVLPHWHRKMSIIDVIKLINETKELIKNKHAHIEIRRVYIPKSNGKFRPLGVPRLSHRIYLHMINNLLSIYISGQVLINPNQHGFQPGKGTLTAWKQIISEVIEAENIWEFDLVKFFDEIHVQAILDQLIEKGCPFFIQKLLGELCMSKPILPVRREDWKLDETAFLPIPTFLKLKQEDGSIVTLENNKQMQLDCVSNYRKKKQEILQDFDQPSTYDKMKVEPAKSVPQGGSLSPPLSTLGLEESLFKQLINKILELEKAVVKIVMYADDGLIYWDRCSFEIEKIFDQMNEVLAPFGISFSLEKSGWVKKSGKWLRPLKFVGISYDGSVDPPILKASTRNGATLPVSLEILEFVKKYELNKQKDKLVSQRQKLDDPINNTKHRYSEHLATLRLKVKELMKIRKSISQGGLAPRLSAYQIMARSDLFGFIQNRLYQNSVNLMPVKQNFSIFNELKGNSLINLIMSSGARLEGMGWNKVLSLLTVFNASTVASDILLRLLCESPLTSLKDYKRKDYWYSYLNMFLCKYVRWHDLCPRLRIDKFGVAHDLLKRHDYIAATSVKEPTVLVLLRKAELDSLTRDQLLARYSYFCSSKSKDLKISRAILSELRVRHRILGVLDPAQYIGSEERSILIEMHIETKYNVFLKSFKLVLKEYKRVTLRILNYYPKFKSWIFTLDTSFLSFYELENVVRPSTEENLAEIYRVVRTGCLIPPSSNVEPFESLLNNPPSRVYEWIGSELSGISKILHPLRYEVRSKINEKSGIYMWSEIAFDGDRPRMYVGSSVNLWRRLLEYLNENNLKQHSHMKICDSLLIDGFSNYKYTILEFCSPGEVLERENYYIDTLAPCLNETRALSRPDYSVWKAEQVKLGEILGKRWQLLQNILNPPKITVKKFDDLSPVEYKAPMSVELSAEEIFLLKTKYPQYLEPLGDLNIGRIMGVNWLRWFKELSDLEKVQEILGCGHLETSFCSKCKYFLLVDSRLELESFGYSLIYCFGQDPTIYQNKEKLSKLLKTNSKFSSPVEVGLRFSILADMINPVQGERETYGKVVPLDIKYDEIYGKAVPLDPNVSDETLDVVPPQNETEQVVLASSSIICSEKPILLSNKKNEKCIKKDNDLSDLSTVCTDVPDVFSEEYYDPSDSEPEDFGDLFDFYDPKAVNPSVSTYVPSEEEIRNSYMSDDE